MLVTWVVKASDFGGHEIPPTVATQVLATDPIAPETRLFTRAVPDLAGLGTAGTCLGATHF